MSQSLLNMNYRETLDNVDSYEEYLSSIKDTLDTQEWKKALSIDTQYAYKNYLYKYSNGVYKDKAQKKIDYFIKIEAKEADKRAWEKAKKKNSKKSYEKYLMSYYNGIYSHEAKRKVDEFIRLEKEEHRLAVAKEKETWELVCRKDTKEDYKNYLKFYPNGIYYNEAKKKIKHIKFNEDVEAWSKACLKNTYTEYIKYCQNFPNGIQFEEAERKATLLYKELTPKTNYSGQRLFTFQKNGKYGVVDITDKIILKAQYNQIEFIGNRYILVHSDGYKQGLYSTSGKEIIALGDYDLRVDGDGYKTEIEKEDNPHDYYTFATISYNKQWIDNSSFMKMFDSSVIKIIDIKNDTFGYIYKNNDELILEPIYKNIELIKSGVGIIRTRNDKYGLINKQYRIILEPKYDLIITHNPYDIFIVSIFDNKDNSISGLVNLKGEIVIPCIFDWIETLDNGCFIAHKNEKGNILINSYGEKITNYYTHITYLKKEKIFLIEDNDKFGFTNTKGKITIEPELDEVYSGNFSSYGHKPNDTSHKYLFFNDIEEPIKVKKDNKYGFIDKRGSYLLYPKYNYISYQEYISKNVYLYLIAEDSNGYKKGFLIYNNGKTTTVFSKTIDITYINLLNKNLIEFSDTAFGRGISTIDGKILLESTNPISYKFKKNKIIEEYKK